MGQKLVKTTKEIWEALLNVHGKELDIFGSNSDPMGRKTGGLKGEMMTEYGFKDSTCGLIRSRTTWGLDMTNPHVRKNEKKEYWLIVPIEDEE